MGQVIVSAEMGDKLRAAGRVIEFRDETGTLIGRFERKRTFEEMKGLLENPDDWPSDEELDRIFREEPRYTTAEVIEHLRGLSK